MINFRWRSLLLCLWAFGLMFTSCDWENDVDDENAPQARSLRNQLKDGPWYVSHFSEYGQDETDDFIPYTLYFEKNGRVRVLEGGQEIAEGSWRTEFDDGELELYIQHLNKQTALGELNDDWYLKSETEMELRFEEEDEPGERLHLHRIAE